MEELRSLSSECEELRLELKTLENPSVYGKEDQI